MKLQTSEVAASTDDAGLSQEAGDMEYAVVEEKNIQVDTVHPPEGGTIIKRKHVNGKQHAPKPAGNHPKAKR